MKRGRIVSLPFGDMKEGTGLKSKSGCFELVPCKGGRVTVMGIIHLTCRYTPGALISGIRCPCSTRLPAALIKKRNQMNRVFKKYEITQA